MPGGNLSHHYARMDRLAARLQLDSRFRSKRPFLLLYPSDEPVMHLGERLIRTLTQGRVILATIDSTWGIFPQKLTSKLKRDFAPILSCAIAVPYLPHPHAVNDFGEAKQVDLMYEGGLHRHQDFGTRKRVASVLMAINASRRARVRLSVPHEYHRQQDSQAMLRNSPADSAARLRYIEGGRAFGNSRVCAAPMGDTITTRRLFDAM